MVDIRVAFLRTTLVDMDIEVVDLSSPIWSSSF